METPMKSASRATTAAPTVEGAVDLRRLRRPPTQLGEIFEEEWRRPHPSGISQAKTADAMGMSRNRLNEIVVGKRGVTAETAVLFGALAGVDARVWLQLQADHDRRRALRKTDVSKVHPPAAS